MCRILSLCFLVSLIGACSSDLEKHQPKSAEQQRMESRGKLTGESGLILFGAPDEEKAAGASPIGVNSYLWRAALDTLSFMPFVSADPFGGTIITDWYEDPNARGERFKVNVLILDKTLRADGVKVTLFKQKLTGSTWRDQPVDSQVARALEDTILTRARQLRLGSR